MANRHLQVNLGQWFLQFISHFFQKITCGNKVLHVKRHAPCRWQFLNPRDLLSILEVCLRDTLYKSTFTLLYFTLPSSEWDSQTAALLYAMFLYHTMGSTTSGTSFYGPDAFSITKPCQSSEENSKELNLASTAASFTLHPPLDSWPKGSRSLNAISLTLGPTAVVSSSNSLSLSFFMTYSSLE